MNPYTQQQTGQAAAPANPYAKAQAYRQTTVNTSSPANLVLMLYDGTIRFLNSAKEGFSSEDPVEMNQTVNRCIQKAQAIIRELRAALDMKQDDEDFGERMASLYDYFDRRLQEANMEKKQEPIDEVIERLIVIRNAWDEMLRKEMQNTGPSQATQSSGEVGHFDLSG